MKEQYVRWGQVKSCIRELTAYGAKRKAEIGAEKVFDFSIGSPSAPVPKPVWEALRSALMRPDAHEKTPPEGLFELRKAVAEDLALRITPRRNCPETLGLPTTAVPMVIGAVVFLRMVHSTFPEM